jgi:hypothetical protein
MDATIGINPVVARSENKLLSFRNTEKKQKELSFPRNVVFPPATNVALLPASSSLPKFSHLRNFHGEKKIFVLKRQIQHFYHRNQFRSESQILNLIMGQRSNHLVVGRLFRKRNFTTQAHRFLFGGIIIYPLPRIKCFSQSNLR